MGAPVPDLPLGSSTPSAPLGRPLSFEIAPELALGKEARAARTVPAALAGGLGVFLLFFAILVAADHAAGGSGLALLLGFGAVVLLAVAIAVGRPATSTGPSTLRIDERGVEFVPPGGKSIRAEWTDPSFKVDLREFTTDRERVLRKGDPRVANPQWVSFYAPPRRSPRLETTAPPEALRAILERAEAHGLLVRPVRVGFYWYHVARGPGFLAYEVEGDIQRADRVNGVIQRVRGSAWNAYPDE